MWEETNARISAFRTILMEVSGLEDLPSGVEVDMTDLLGTLEKGAQLLTELLKGDFPRSETAKRLMAIELLASDEIPMIAKDLRPALTRLRAGFFATARAQPQGSLEYEVNEDS